MKSYFCILYSKLLKVETTELKCPNHLNSSSHGGRDVLSVHIPSSYSFPSCCERKWKWWLRSWLMEKEIGKSQDKSQLLWVKLGEELTYQVMSGHCLLTPSWERGTELGHPKGDRESQLEKAIVKQLIDRCRLWWLHTSLCFQTDLIKYILWIFLLWLL